MATAQKPPEGSPGAALLEARDQTARGADRIDHDPEEALHALEQAGLHVAPNVGEITPADMFRLVAQMQEQMGRMQSQLIELMTGKLASPTTNDRQRELQEELKKDAQQRDLTLQAWREEPREMVYIQPDPDEEKVQSVTGEYPPRIFRINGLEFPIKVGEGVLVPESVAVAVRQTQRRRPLQRPPQGLPQIEDPLRAQFLASSQSIQQGRAGKAGEGQIVPSRLPPPQPLDVKYDQYGQ